MEIPKSGFLLSFLQYLLPYLSTEIFGAEQKTFLDNIGERMPLPSLGCLEVKLDVPKVEVDLTIDLVQTFGERDALLEMIESQNVDQVPLNLSPILEFVRMWSKPTSVLQDAVPNIWVNFDNIGNQDKQLDIWFYAGLSPHPFGPEVEKSLATKVMKLISPILFQQLNPFLKTFLNQLGQNQYISGIATLELRDVSKYRLIISSFKHPDKLLSFLERTGWQGDLPVLNKIISELFPIVHHCDLAMDIGEGPAEKIGLEFFLHPCSNKEHFRLLTEKISQFHPLVIEKQHAITSYIGRAPLNAPAPWRANQGFVVHRHPCRQAKTVERWVMHLKITFDSSRITSVKAYLGFMYVKDITIGRGQSKI